MHPVFHEGERAVQQRAGVGHMAARVGNGIHDAIPPAAREFLSAQPFAVVGARDAEGRVWASALWGTPGFLSAPDGHTLRVEAVPGDGDPLAAAIADAGTDGVDVGVLVIEPATRRRMRLNGRAHVTGNRMEIRAEQVYANCPKYIQKREVVERPEANGGVARRTPGPLTPHQRERVARADTFFIASAHPERGADTSHRGGNAGFVRVSEDGATLVWPDYSGNAMFNTLGNLAVNPAAGLLFLDWQAGDILQLTGEATILWEGMEVESLPGAERVVAFRVAEVVERPGAFPLRYRLEGYSPFNPA